MTNNTNDRTCETCDYCIDLGEFYDKVNAAILSELRKRGNTMSKPLKCPFCRETNAYYEVDEWYNGCFVCYTCGATGPKVQARRGAYSKAKSLWMKAVEQ